MKVEEAITLIKKQQQSSLKDRTQESYNYVLARFGKLYGDRPLESIGPSELYTFLEVLTEGSSRSTRRLRYAQIKAFYNLIIENCSLPLRIPAVPRFFLNRLRCRNKRLGRYWIRKPRMS